MKEKKKKKRRHQEDDGLISSVDATQVVDGEYLTSTCFPIIRLSLKVKTRGTWREI
jgi:hypothetical protein